MSDADASGTTRAALVIGTAGHIDHGKTSLVRSLTGIDTDRLKVEKERGITTELGFAHLDEGGQRYGFVDVPGHERFIRAMVAGAGGMDVVLLVVAADEGVMPQTREHLEVCQLLGVRSGVIALSKCDRAEAELRELARADVANLVSGTFLAGAPIIEVSAVTGAGLDELRKALGRACRDLSPRNEDGAFRLPIDRVFTLKGFGTVVTGTVRGGVVRVRDEVEIAPGGPHAKVRGIQVHGHDQDSAGAGERAALNLAGIGVDEVTRGQTVIRKGGVAASHILDVELEHLPSSRAALQTRQRVIVHHGTRQVLGVVTLAGDAPIEPGGTGLGQLRLDRSQPLVAAPGDRFLLRGFGPQTHYGTTLGGGRILRTHAIKRRRGRGVGELEALREASVGDHVLAEVERAGLRGLSASEIAARLALAPESTQEQLNTALAGGELVAMGERMIGGRALAALEGAIRDVLNDRDSVLVAELPGLLGHGERAGVVQLAVTELERRGTARVVEGALRRGERAQSTVLDPRDRELLERYREWGLTPPRPAELSTELGIADAAHRAEALVRRGLLVRVKHDLFVHGEIMAELEGRLLAFLATHESITPGQWKEMTGTSRKYAIPLAEHFDDRKLTLRVGDVRKRRGGVGPGSRPT